MDFKDVIGGGTIALGVIVSALGWFLGGYDGILTCVLIVMAVDVITGWMKAIYNKNISSRKGWRGILKKFAYLLVIGIVSIIDIHVLNIHGALRYAFLIWMIGNDGFSIVENLISMDVKLPNKLTLIFELMQKRIDDIEIPKLEEEATNENEAKQSSEMQK